MIYRNFWLMLLMFACLGLTAACSMLPRVRIIDDPLNKEEHFNLGMAYEKNGELELAEREYRLALPRAEAALALGNMAYQEKGDAQQAQKYYRQALASEKLPAAANNLAWLLLVERGDLSEALKLAQLAVAEGEKRNLPANLTENFLGTLVQIEKAIAAGRNIK
ncbi:MAG: tetratricopeptide repeat protein [Deltaproteobacteria bacterium]|jgi:tetratricopeptide (TPR) repeat protein|nr:tetratricopeptide repeat protein [Deltaproteobacteria bacterium]